MNIKMIFSKVFFFSLFFLCVHGTFAAPPWSKVYHRAIEKNDFESMKHKKMFAFAKQDVMPFTQLIFAWNAQRPEKGFLSFFVQVREKESKKWGEWHHMMDWGKDIQKSHVSKSDGMSSFHHVRLEMEPDKIADAFKIKVVAKDGADLKDLKGIAVTLSNFKRFSAEESSTTARFLPTVYVHSVPRYSQFALDHSDKTRICSPTACAMLINYLNGKQNPKDIVNRVFDKGLDAYGSWPFNTAHAYECCKGRIWFYPTRLDSFAHLHNQLTRGLPVIVSVRGSLPTAASQYAHGHLLVVVGWDAKTKDVLVHDPAFSKKEEIAHRYPLADFLRAWEKSHRLAYWAEPVKIKRKR